MNKYIKYIVIAIIIILIIVSIILINNDKPINRYKRQIKSIINEYINKNIDNKYARKKINEIILQIDEEREKSNNLDLSILSSKANQISLLLMQNDYIEIKQKIKDL